MVQTCRVLLVKSESRVMKAAAGVVGADGGAGLDSLTGGFGESEYQGNHL